MPNTIQSHADQLLGLVGERVETRGYVDLMTTFGQGQLSKIFTIGYLIVNANISYFVLIGGKTLNKLEAIVSTPHLKMKFPTLIGETVTVKLDQKQARQCYTKSLKVAPYPPTKEPTKPHPTTNGTTQVMSMDEGSPVQALTIFQVSLDDEFDVDPRDDTFDRVPKPIESLSSYSLNPILSNLCNSVGTSPTISTDT